MLDAKTIPVIPQLRAKRITGHCPPPIYKTAGAAGMDIHAARWATHIGAEPQEFPLSGNIKVMRGQRVVIHTGWALKAPENWALMLMARSGKACKEGLRPSNCVGLIDSDFTGELLAVMHADGPGEFVTIRQGEAIAQVAMVFAPQAQLVEVSEFDYSERGANGFGSTSQEKRPA